MLLRIDFNIGWLKKKSDEGVRVVRLVEKWVASAGMACVKASAPDSVVVEIEPSRRADFEGALAKKFADDFAVKDISKFVSCSVLSDKNRQKSAGAGMDAAKASPPAESPRVRVLK